MRRATSRLSSLSAMLRLSRDWSPWTTESDSIHRTACHEFQHGGNRGAQSQSLAVFGSLSYCIDGGSCLWACSNDSLAVVQLQATCEDGLFGG